MAQVCERVPPLIPLTLSQMQWMVGFCQQLVDCSSSRIFFPNKIINFKFRVNLSPSRTIIFLLLSSELYFCWAHYHSWHFIASLPPKRILFFSPQFRNTLLFLDYIYHPGLIKIGVLEDFAVVFLLYDVQKQRGTMMTFPAIFIQGFY